MFFDSLVSDEDLSKLLCTCIGMKEMILKWKTVFPIQEFEIKSTMTDKMLENMIIQYSHSINKLRIDNNFCNSSLTIDGYHHLSLLNPNLLELSIYGCLKGGIDAITSSLVSSLKISQTWKFLSEEWDSLSKLTNLENLELRDIDHLYNAPSVENCSTLTKMKSITVKRCDDFSGLGLSYLVANKELLVLLKIESCNRISSEGYHCLTTLTNLTSLTVRFSKLDDIGLNVICSSCLLIEYLYIKYNNITIKGLDNINFLIHLKLLFLSSVTDNWAEKLSHNTTLTNLDISRSTLSDEGLSLLCISLVNLSSVLDDGQQRLY
jgi:hypothetical protein